MQRFFPGRFESKVALVMGVGRGSTKEAVVRMAAEGANLVITDIVKEFADKAAEECRGYGRKALAFAADAADGKLTREIVFIPDLEWPISTGVKTREGRVSGESEPHGEEDPYGHCDRMDPLEDGGRGRIGF